MLSIDHKNFLLSFAMTTPIPCESPLKTQQVCLCSLSLSACYKKKCFFHRLRMIYLHWELFRALIWASLYKSLKRTLFLTKNCLIFCRTFIYVLRTCMKRFRKVEAKCLASAFLMKLFRFNASIKTNFEYINFSV